MPEAAVATQFQTFVVAPQLLKQGKTSTRLARTEHINAGVQVVADGGETNLHAHPTQDEIWLVLGGEAKFYTTDDQLVATLGKYEGILVPHDAPYWFESSSEENLVVMRVGAAVPGATGGRVDFGGRKWAVSGEPGGQKRENVFADTVFGR